MGHNAGVWLSAPGWESAQGGGVALAPQVALAPLACARHAIAGFDAKPSG